jgi:guanine deaminase
MSLLNPGGAPRTVAEAADLLFGVMMVGDERAVPQTWLMGSPAYRKP